jgi:hypothetical protein
MQAREEGGSAESTEIWGAVNAGALEGVRGIWLHQINIGF